MVSKHTVDDNMVPGTPTVHDDTPRGKTDPNEMLFGHDEMSDDETADDIFNELSGSDLIDIDEEDDDE